MSKQKDNLWGAGLLGLTEFLRATTARSAGFQGRFLEGLGIAGTQANGSSFYPQDSMTQPYMQQHLQQAAAAMSSTRSYPQQAAAAISSTRMTQQQHAAAMTSTGVLSRQAPTTVPVFRDDANSGDADIATGGAASGSGDSQENLYADAEEVVLT